MLFYCSILLICTISISLFSASKEEINLILKARYMSSAGKWFFKKQRQCKLLWMITWVISMDYLFVKIQIASVTIYQVVLIHVFLWVCVYLCAWVYWSLCLLSLSLCVCVYVHVCWCLCMFVLVCTSNSHTEPRKIEILL